MKTKRVISVFLALALALGITMPPKANAANRAGEISFMDCANSYVLPYSTMDQKGAVLGQSTTIQFYAHLIDKKAKTLIIQIESPYQYLPVEIFRIPLKQGCYSFSWTWNVPKSKYKEGQYMLSAFLGDGNGDSLGWGTNSIYLNVVSSPVPATGLDILSRDGLADYTTLILYTEQDYDIVSARFIPLNSTSDRSVSYTSSDPSVVKITEQGAGHAYLSARKTGTATITAKCGKLTSSITVRVKTIDSLYFVRVNATKFCPDQTFLLDTAAPGFTSVVSSWSSSDPSVVCVDKDNPFLNGSGQYNSFMYFKCLKPGTAVITANNGGKTASVEITVREHEPTENVHRLEPTCTLDGMITGKCAFCNKQVQVVLPALGHQLDETAVRIEPTATQPGSLTGKCTVCGDENASIELPAIFTDTKATAWYAGHVDKVYDAGLMNGTGEHTFAPNANVTRAMAATVLYRIAGEPAVATTSSFLDVPLKSYYTSAVIWAQQNEVVNGYPDGTFRPNDNITREQLAAILYRYAKAGGNALESDADLSAFPDSGKVHAYAAEAMGWAVGAGLINGVGSGGQSWLQPANNATRAQFATIISRYLTALESTPEQENPEIPSPADPGAAENN